MDASCFIKTESILTQKILFFFLFPFTELELTAEKKQERKKPHERKRRRREKRERHRHGLTEKRIHRGRLHYGAGSIRRWREQDQGCQGDSTADKDLLHKSTAIVERNRASCRDAKVWERGVCWGCYSRLVESRR